MQPFEFPKKISEYHYWPLTTEDWSSIAVRHNLETSHNQRALGMLSVQETERDDKLKQIWISRKYASELQGQYKNVIKVWRTYNDMTKLAFRK